ncbi:MAG: Do family serine endopeptidase [Terriglobales bacterium]
MNWIKTEWKKSAKRSIIAFTLSIAMVGGFASYELFRPVDAHAAPAPAASALDDNSVSALLSLDHAMETLAARVTPAVVNVTVTSKTKPQQTSQQDMPNDMQQFFGQFFGQQGMPRMQMQPRQPQFEHGLGSGVIISPDGYIVTNNHVVEGATDIRVTLSDKRVLSAKLIGTDPLTDLAVIKINGNNFPSIPWGVSKDLKVGQSVLAFGNPYGFRFTVTRGIVSAIDRANPDSEDPRKPGGFIQTDAAINPGNSGGALVDSHGQLMGINTFLISPSGTFSGMGFAIPSQIAQPIAQKLIQSGKVEHAKMGVSISDVTPENAKFFDLKKADGALVTQVQNDSPAGKAGLKTGDVITAINGKPVSDASDLQMTVALKSPGDKVNLTVLRNGHTEDKTVTLAAMNENGTESASNATHDKARWGVGIQDLSPDLRSELQLATDVKGAVVTNVQPGSPADNAGLRQGDVILQVNRKDTTSAQAVKEALSSVPQGQDALVLVHSNGGDTFRVLHAPENNG